MNEVDKTMKNKIKIIGTIMIGTLIIFGLRAIVKFYF